MGEWQGLEILEVPILRPDEAFARIEAQRNVFLGRPFDRLWRLSIRAQGIGFAETAQHIPGGLEA